MIFEQILTPDLGCAAYLVGSEASGEAVVVDPPLDTAGLEQALDRHGVRLVAVLETHTHADHVSGHGVLALERGVPVHVHPAAEARFPHVPLADGAALRVGDVSLVTVHAPGHRPEHCVFLVVDHSRADEPWLALTGDSLFVGDVARPDLAVPGAEGAARLFHSLYRRLLALPDGVEVFPGHVAGSLCGRRMSAKGSTTIGFERRHNPMLQLADERAFVHAATADPAARPPNLERIVERNRGPFRPRRADPVELDVLPVGATPLDVRRFADGHVPGALHVPVASSGFATRAAWFVAPDAPVVLLASSAEEARRAARRLAAVASDGVVGWVEAASVEGLPALPSLPVGAIVAPGPRLQVVDVRDASEAPPALPWATRVPLHALADAPLEGLDAVRPTAVVCGTGVRAGIGASVLARRGFRDVRAVLDGGMATLPAGAAR